MKALIKLVGSCVSVGLLSACGGGISPSSTPVSVAPAIPVQTIYAPDARGTSHTFNYTGAKQRFKVPPGVTSITITASGASGGSAYSSGDGKGSGGAGGLMEAKIAVKSGERLAVYVGGTGDSSSTGYGGFNGGGDGECKDGSCSGGGGGASDVREGGNALADRVVVAGGGGGGGNSDGYSGFGTGGAGGLGGAQAGTQGGDGKGFYIGNAVGGGPGTHTAGGKGGAGAGESLLQLHDDERFLSKGSYCYGDAGGNGKLGTGGDGGTNCDIAGGGGGGGYYGGGGGGSGASCYNCSRIRGGPETGPFAISPSAGGGGGSGFIERPAMHIQSIQGGAAPGNGQVVIAW
jgi:hypothetical protein